MAKFQTPPIALLSLAWLAVGHAACATVLASSSFDSGAEGWRNGEFTVGNATLPVTFDNAGFITTADNFAHSAFLAPVAFLGDKSAALGGVISFDLGDAFNDGPSTYPLVTLTGAGKLVFGGVVTDPPSTTGFTHYDVALVASNFRLGDPDQIQSSTAVSQSDFNAILHSLTQVGINADLHAGDDLARLDNVVLSAGPPAVGGVPEPTSWILSILGFGLVGAALRRRRATRRAVDDFAASPG